MSDSTRPSAVLLDIDGCVVESVGGCALPGAVETCAALRERATVRFVTNTTSKCRSWLAESLRREGFVLSDEEVVTPTSLAQRVLVERNESHGVLIADNSAMVDLGWYETTAPEDAASVLLASEGHQRKVGEFQQAVVALLGGAKLYTLQQNRIFRRNGQILTDLGPLAAFLGYAANVPWQNLGKPSPLLFETLAADLRCGINSLMMVGDDAEFDVAGALRAGVGHGVLVRTGKFRPGDEERFSPSPTMTLDSIACLPDALDRLASA